MILILFLTSSCVFFYYHMEIQTQKEVSPLTNSYLIHMGTIECNRLLKDFLIRKMGGGGGGVGNVDINKQMMKSCKASRERYELDLAAKRKQKLEEEALPNAKKQETAKEAEKAPNSKIIEEQNKEIEHDILLMKSGIKIAEDSVDEGNKELEACLRSVNLDRNKLISKQNKYGCKKKR